MKIDAEKSPFLVERLGVWMMPTIVLVIKGKVAHQIVFEISINLFVLIEMWIG